MLLIAHRGNINGPNPLRENHPDYILSTIEKGYNVEVDLWYLENTWVLGHDEPEYEVSDNMLGTFKFRFACWYHTKNLEALDKLCSGERYKNWQYFWHENDEHTLTSNNKIWTFPEKRVTINSIIVCHTKEETKRMSKKDIYGICSDYVGDIK